MKHKLTSALLLLLAISSLACAGLFEPRGQADLITRDQQGGVYALIGDRGKAWLDLKNKANAHCGQGGYEIVREENAVVGQQTTTNANTNTSADRYSGSRTRDGYHSSRTRSRSSTYASSNTSVNTQTSQVKQYQVTYECRQSGRITEPPVNPT